MDWRIFLDAALAAVAALHMALACWFMRLGLNSQAGYRRALNGWQRSMQREGELIEWIRAHHKGSP